MRSAPGLGWVCIALLAACAGRQAVGLRDYPPQGFQRARVLYEAGDCNAYVHLLETEGSQWSLYSFDASQLNVWTAECFLKRGWHEDANALFRQVIDTSPETGLADRAQARLEGHAWTPVKALSLPRPQYPGDARHSGFQGLVHATATVASDGTVTHARISGASPGGVFDEAILSALRRGRFAAARRDDEPVTARFDLFFRFMLQ